MLAVLAALAYFSRHRIHLADFTWRKFSHAVGQANPWLLLLALAGIYGCYALRAVRWQQFSKYLGPTRFTEVCSATIMGFASIFVLGRIYLLSHEVVPHMIRAGGGNIINIGSGWSLK